MENQNILFEKVRKYYIIKQCATGKIMAIKEGSLQIRDPQLFNRFPVNIRGQSRCSMTSFK